MIPMLIVISILLVVLIALTCYLIFKQPTPFAVPPDTRIDTLLIESKNNGQSNREDLAALRREQQEQASALRSELDRRLELNNQTILGRLDESRRDALTQAETTRKALDARLVEARDEADKTLAALRSEATEAAATTRAENRQQFSEIQQVLRTSLEDARTAQGEQGKAIDSRLIEARDSTEKALATLRSEATEAATTARGEQRQQLTELQQALRMTLEDARTAQLEQIKAIATSLSEYATNVSKHLDGMREIVESKLRESAESSDQRLTRLRTELTDNSTQARTESRQQFTDFQNATKSTLTDAEKSQSTQLADFSQRLKDLNTAVTEQLDKIRQTVEQRLTELQTQNSAKLDEMRQTVDQRLQTTLEQRLGESFKIVSESLERVTHGLGEMQSIAAGVGDLKKVLTNVKTRGTWSEYQLGALLEQILTPDQYASNVAPIPTSLERVEFAIKLPGKDAADKPVWLPIDAKFPVEDYQRFVEASEKADAEGIASAGSALELRLRSSARDIATKYVASPHTTDFAILYLPTEGLYAEALRRAGLVESLQQQHHVLLAGPMTLAALLNSLQMGFRTLAIQQRSSEVWQVLGAVKTEFAKFGDVIAKVKKKLDEASSQIDQTGVRSRAIERRLRSVETLPADDVARLIPELTEGVPEPEGDSTS
jgi:DNA recombination protein RmuC